MQNDLAQPVSLKEAEQEVAEFIQLWQNNLPDEKYKKLVSSLVDVSTELISDAFEIVLDVAKKHDIDAANAFNDTSVELLKNPNTRVGAVLLALGNGLIKTETPLSKELKAQGLTHKLVVSLQKILFLIQEKYPDESSQRKLLKSFLTAAIAHQKFESLWNKLQETLA